MSGLTLNSLISDALAMAVAERCREPIEDCALDSLHAEAGGSRNLAQTITSMSLSDKLSVMLGCFRCQERRINSCRAE
jgi:hypothetical protein